MENNNKENKNLTALPIWMPNACPKFNDNMQANAPFIVTREMTRTDLGLSIIGTRYPRVVARYVSFPTQRGITRVRKDGTTTQAQIAEEGRRAYLDGRALAIENGREAAKRGITVKEYIEDILGRVYDEEYDEPRPVAKVPGLNAYLELRGCMDDLKGKDVDWASVLHQLDLMAEWAQNIWIHRDRKYRASRLEDLQPLDEWEEEYDPAVSPMLYPKRGIGLTEVDYSRRPELLHVKTSRDTGITKERIAEIKAARQHMADMNAMGFKE